MVPLHKGRRVISSPSVLTRWKVVQAVPTNNQPRKPPCAQHPMLKPTHLPSSHLFLLVQNLSSKQIAPTDNMWPKSDDAKKCHQWLKDWKGQGKREKSVLWQITERVRLLRLAASLHQSLIHLFLVHPYRQCTTMSAQHMYHSLAREYPP